MKNELKYWAVESGRIFRCCKSDLEAKWKSKSDEISLEKSVIEELNRSPFQIRSIKEKLWKMTQFPSQSNAAMVRVYYS